jgi:hypothetical protein
MEGEEFNRVRDEIKERVLALLDRIQNNHLDQFFV